MKIDNAKVLLHLDSEQPLSKMARSLGMNYYTFKNHVDDLVSSGHVVYQGCFVGGKPRQKVVLTRKGLSTRNALKKHLG